METDLIKQLATQNTIVAYIIYLTVMLALTFWVARIIHRNSRAFLTEIFTNSEAVALAVNNLLQMGFYLLSFGYGFLNVQISYSPSWYGNNDETARLYFMSNTKDVIEELAVKLGGLTLFIGSLLLFNLFLMLILRKGSRVSRQREQQFQQYIQGVNK